MNQCERYLFDLQGYLKIDQALSPEQVAALNIAIDQKVAGYPPEPNWLRFDRLLPWGEPFQTLINSPRITPYLDALLGANYRLDHDYLHIIRYPGPGPIGSWLHGGGTPYDPCQYYHYRNGQMYNGLVAIAYELKDVEPGDGGFACIPGSHKSNMPLPKQWENLDDFEQVPDYVKAIAAPAGTAILFTEALTHGTLPWRSHSERRTLFFKYSPRVSAWSRSYYNPDDYPSLSEPQQHLLRSPGLSPYP